MGHLRLYRLVSVGSPASSTFRPVDAKDGEVLYDIWGDAVNTASHMESHGVPGKIQLTRATYELIKGDFECSPRGVVEVKGKGPMETWFLEGVAT